MSYEELTRAMWKICSPTSLHIGYISNDSQNTPKKELLKSQNFSECSNFLLRNKNNLPSFFFQFLSVYHGCLKNLTLNIDKVITCLVLVFSRVRISNQKSFVLIAHVNSAQSMNLTQKQPLSPREAEQDKFLVCSTGQHCHRSFETVS